jgi:hypothetical protein
MQPRVESVALSVPSNRIEVGVNYQHQLEEVRLGNFRYEVGWVIEPQELRELDQGRIPNDDDLDRRRGRILLAHTVIAVNDTPVGSTPNIVGREQEQALTIGYAYNKQLWLSAGEPGIPEEEVLGDGFHRQWYDLRAMKVRTLGGDISKLLRRRATD